MSKKINKKEGGKNIHRITDLLIVLIPIIRKNLGLSIALILIVGSGAYYLFLTDTETEYHDRATFPNPVTNTPSYYIFVSSVTKNEFIVGQTIHIEAYILFTDNQSYNYFEKNIVEIGGEKINLIMGSVPPFETIFFTTDAQSYGKLLLIVSDASPVADTNWFTSPVILISETNEPLREELKSTYITDKYLKGETDVIFHQSGIHEIYTFSNGIKVPISKITISPRTVGYELKSNKWTVIFALIGIVLAFLSIFKKKD